jgi:hypothetical protein
MVSDMIEKTNYKMSVETDVARRLTDLGRFGLGNGGDQCARVMDECSKLVWSANTRSSGLLLAMGPWDIHSFMLDIDTHIAHTVDHDSTERASEGRPPGRSWH